MGTIDPATGRVTRGWPSLARLIVVLMAGAVLSMLVMGPQAWNAARTAAGSAACRNNIHQIGLALESYHEAWGRFPPAYLADEHGRPMHSWRVLILPYLEQYDLYTSYNFAQPWDGPGNRPLVDRMPGVYACLNRHPDQRKSLTSYAAITGEGTAFPGDRSTDRAAIRDGTSTTLMLGEVADVAIPWTAPWDIDASALGDPSRPGMSTRDPGGPVVMFADGRYRRLVEPLSPATLRALSSIDGGEPIDPEILP
ncbi:DUF1559 domain-containing protein [Tundrisphaera sp. TA3]|uniref:DUF1559 family PulG-like putative transporter n=1 Tax=Tundrisphaera sp. TA3 TaxID=3435775 RepID=UPI003EBF2B42